jgi:hypothetical protein
VISVNNFSSGIHAFGTDAAVRGYLIDGVILANNGSPAAAPSNPRRPPNLFLGAQRRPADDVTIANSLLYSPPGTSGGALTLGWLARGNGRAVVRDNYLATGAAGLNLQHWRSVTVQGNTLHASGAGTRGTAAFLTNVQPDPAAESYVWNGNTYFDATRARGAGTPFRYTAGGGPLSWSRWRQRTGFDATSTYRSGPPTGQQVFVRPNRYEPGRANVAVLNWDHSAAFSLDLGIAGLRVGQPYEIRDATNFFGPPVATGIWTGTARTTVPLKGIAPTAPVGMSGARSAATAPEFAALVVLPSGP